MITADELSTQLASLEAWIQQDRELLCELESTVGECAPRMTIPISREDMEEMDSLAVLPAQQRRVALTPWIGIRG